MLLLYIDFCLSVVIFAFYVLVFLRQSLEMLIFGLKCKGQRMVYGGEIWNRAITASVISKKECERAATIVLQ